MLTSLVMTATGLEFKNVVFNAARDGKLRRLKVRTVDRQPWVVGMLPGGAGVTQEIGHWLHLRQQPAGWERISWLLSPLTIPPGWQESIENSRGHDAWQLVLHQHIIIPLQYSP